MSESVIKHFFSDGVYAKQMHLPKGHGAITHQHKYSHLSILAKGTVIVTCDGEQTTYTAPTCIEIKAGVNHGIYAIEDSDWFCVHATEETDVEKVDEVLIKECLPCHG
jgi:quercetin dioxygenase-like cupin family protein